jgi:hypothetical protein
MNGKRVYNDNNVSHAIISGRGLLRRGLVAGVKQ